MLLKKKIIDLGLSDKETQVYVALLELGTANAQDLSIKSGINRASTYAMLESLQKRGLIGSLEREGVTVFIADEPYQLLRSLQTEGEELEKKLAAARSVIPQLQELFNMSRDRNKVRVFEGKESIRVIQNEVLRSKQREFYNITNLSLALKHWPVTGDDYRKGVYAKEFIGHVIIVYDATENVPKLPAFAGETERRYLPMAKFPISGELSLYDGDKIALITLEDPIVAISIENKVVFDMLHVLFQCLWEVAAQYNIDLKK